MLIHADHPGDQLDLCLKALTTLTYALESCDTNCFASTCQMIEFGLKDAVERLEAKHKAECDRLIEAALHISPSKMGTDYFSPSEREKLIERLKADYEA